MVGEEKLNVRTVQWIGKLNASGLLRMEKSTNCNRRDCHTRPIEQTTKW